MAPSPHLFASLVGNAFAIAVVGFAIAISLGKIFALKHGYRVDSNQVWGRDRGHEGANWLPETPGPGAGRVRWDHVGLRVERGHETAGQSLGSGAGVAVGTPRRRDWARW